MNCFPSSEEFWGWRGGETSQGTALCCCLEGLSRHLPTHASNTLPAVSGLQLKILPRIILLKMSGWASGTEVYIFPMQALAEENIVFFFF